MNSPVQAQSHITQVDALLRQGALVAARQLLENIVQVNPDHRDALLRLVDIDLVEKKVAQARSRAARLAQLSPHDDEVQFFMVKVELADLNLDAAKMWMERLESGIKQKTAPFFHLKATLHAQAGDFVQAQAAFREALQIDPGYAQAYSGLAAVLQRSGNLEQARAAWEDYVARFPQNRDAWGPLAEITSLLGDTKQAAEYLRRAVALEPANASLWFALGQLHAESRDLREARRCLERAVAIDAAHEGAISLLAWVLDELGETGAALALLAPAQGLTPSLGRRIRHDLLLPQVYADMEELNRWRSRYADHLARLVEEANQGRLSAEQVFNLNQSNFLLAYQGQNDTGLQQAYAKLMQILIGQVRPDLLAPVKRRTSRDGRIRVGFISGFLYECTVGHYFRSWIEGLDPKRFERFVFYNGARSDQLTSAVAAGSEHFLALRSNTTDIAQTIRDQNLDILIYPEVGMYSANYLLAAMRLAPIQCAGWGHPVTTGSSNMDYFLTCGDMEPPDAAQHYCEKLIPLPGIGTRYALPPPHQQEPARSNFFLPENRHLYLCPQSLFKIHPENDAPYLDILERDPEAVLVFFAAPGTQVTQAFAQRLTRGMASRKLAPRSQIKFLPRIDTAAFRAVLGLADVVLDTLHWSGGNTSLDALAVGAAIVTLPGSFMRGRQSMAMLEILGVPELIAASPAEYVAKATHLAGDIDLRQGLKERTISARDKLFNRAEPIEALSENLQRIFELMSD
jgi:CRISPR-associated protein Csy1